ncbi:hypothetical protein AAFC00_006227 [Neodothiora populina]|uniref:Thioredoxin domain-containing protein n=1 Tax=Neodothiora populina TaxID=2781224 RepID=A0ABR3P4W8_9PEZI
MATCTVNEVISPADFSNAISSNPSALSVIYFHASWAEPCKHMSSAIETLASTYPATNPPNTVFIRVDADDVSDVAEQYDVASVPYIVLQKNGQVIEVVSSPSIAAVRAAVEKHAGAASASSGTTGLPPPQQVQQTTKNLGDYAPSASEQQTAPEFSSGDHAAAAAQQQESKEELNGRLSELVKAAPVMLFMKGTPSSPQCGFSRQTVALLREKGVRYGFFNILADDDVRQGLKEFSDWPTFPQVYCDGELVGGLDILREEFENDPEFMKDYAVGPKGGPGM